MSSIGKKTVMAVTGGVLFGFVVLHMLGNLQVFLGQEALNAYAKKLQDMAPVLWAARAFLLASLVLHVAFAIRLTFENRRARPKPYLYNDTVQASYASRTMMMTGLIVLFFTIYHLLHFTFGVTNPDLFHLVDAKGRHDVYSMVVSSFRNPWISASYVIAMIPLCVHLSHGLSSALQTLGLNRARPHFLYANIGNLMGLAIFIGNSSIPLAALLGLLKIPVGAPHA